MPSPSGAIIPQAEWIPEADQFFSKFDDLFDTGARGEETQRSARAYFTGLHLPNEERKSVENLAEKLPETSAHELYHFLAYSPWEAGRVQTRLAQVLGEKIASPLSVLALDDTGLPKQGKASVGVAHQYCGVLGKVANSQAAVSLQYVLPNFDYYPNLSSFLVGMGLYLPEKWVTDLERRKRVGVPEDVSFHPKWRIGLDFIDRARKLKLLHRAVVGDAGFGMPEFRRELRYRKEPYLLGVQPTGTTRVQVEGRGDPVSPEVAAKELTPEQWMMVRWAEGTKGPLEIETARLKVVVWEEGKPTDEAGWLIFERRDNETKTYLAWGMNRLPLVEQLRIMRSRFPIEQSYQHMKEELGLDHFEGRSWRGWHHHVTMVGMAQGFLMLVRQGEERRAERKKGKPRRLPSVPKVRKYLNTKVATGFVRLIEQNPERRVEIAVLMSQVYGTPVWMRDGHPYMPTLSEFIGEEDPPPEVPE